MSSDGNEYEWVDDDVVIQPQGETAVYRNHRNATCIRQRDPFDGNDDNVVVVLPEHLPALIRRLQQHHAENIRGEE
jgi:hypothetical protein